MTLYDMLDKAMADQEVWIFESNAYDQNMPVFRGSINDARVDQEQNVWDYLMCEVDGYDCSNRILDIRVKNKYYEERLEGHYGRSEKWGKNKGERPWLYSIEIDEDKRKTKEGTLMTIKNIYISDDGEEFETAEECIEYEKARDVSGAILMFDSNKQILNDADSVKAFENAMYLYIIDVERAKKFFDFVGEDYGYTVPDEVIEHGLYAYDDDPHCQSYYELSDRIAELEVARDELLDRMHEKMGARWMGLEKGWVYE